MSTPNASPSLIRQTEQLWCYYLRCSRPNLCCDFCSRSCAFCKAEKEELLTLFYHELIFFSLFLFNRPKASKPFSTRSADYAGGVEYFDVYSPVITSRYSEV